MNHHIIAHYRPWVNKLTHCLLTSIILVLVAGCSTTAHKNDAWFGRDKMSHLAVSGVVSAAATKIAQDNGASECRAPMIGFSIAMLVGATKEIHDKHIKGTYYSWKDMTWNLLGSTLGSLVVSNCH